MRRKSHAINRLEKRLHGIRLPPLLDSRWVHSILAAYGLLVKGQPSWFRPRTNALASLNHPNIAQLQGPEESDGVRALVLELVEGPTLADRVSQGAIPLDEALPIAKRIAEALEAAHEAGVIHRDLAYCVIA